MARKLTNVEQEALKIARQGIPVPPENTIPLSPEKLAAYLASVIKDKLELSKKLSNSATHHEPLEETVKWNFFKALILRQIREAFVSAERYQLTVKGYLDGKNPEIIPAEMESFAHNPEFMKGAFNEQIITVLTAHPNGFLGFNLENESREFVGLVTDLIKRSPYLLSDIARWDDALKVGKPPLFGTTLGDISKTLSAMWVGLEIPSKMTPKEESTRLCSWIKASYDSTANYLGQIHQLRYNYSAPQADKQSSRLEETHLNEPSKRTYILDDLDIKQICSGDGRPKGVDEDDFLISERSLEHLSDRTLEQNYGITHKTIAHYKIRTSTLDHRTLSDLRANNWGTSGGYVSVAELESYKPNELEDWVAFDADGKDSTQPWASRFSIQQRKRFVSNLYVHDISNIIADMNDYVTSHPACEDAKDELLKLSSDIYNKKVRWNEIKEKLIEIKTKFEEKGFVFPQAVDSQGKYIAFSKLDVLIVQVKKMKDYGARGQIRQNARENKEGLVAINIILRNIAKTGILPNFDIKADISENPEILNDYLAKFPEEAKLVRKQLFEITRILYLPVKRASKAEKDITAEELNEIRKSEKINGFIDGLDSAKIKRLVQMTGFFYMIKRWPEAIGSVVIAEGATASDEAKKTGDKEIIKNSVVKNGLRDIRQLLAYQLLTGAEGAVKLEAIQLSEDPPTIDNKPALIDAFYNSPDILKSMTSQSEPVMKFDTKLNQWRQMNLAEFKLSRGMSADIQRADYKTPVYYSARLMDAGSDSTLRGSKASAPMISMSRSMTERYCANHPKKVNIDGQEVTAAFMPKVYAGIGEGSARQYGIGNHPSELIHCWTSQGGGNIFKDLNHEVILLQIAHGRAKQRDFELHHKFIPYSNYDEIKASRIKASTTEYRLSSEEESNLYNRSSRAVDARMAMVGSKAYDDHLTWGTNADRGRKSNKSARKQNRSGKDGDTSTYPLPVKFGGFRAIGHSEVDNCSGALATQTYIASFFKDPEKVGNNKLLPVQDRKDLMHFFVKDITTNNLLWDSLDSCYMADYKMAWHAEGCNLSTDKNNKTQVIRELGGKTYKASVAELAEAYKAGTVPEGFRASHTAMAMHHINYMDTSRSVFEVFYRVKYGKLPNGNLSKKDNAMLKNILAEDKFTLDNIPQLLEKLMPHEMKEELKIARADISYAREVIVSEHISKILQSGKETGLSAHQNDVTMVFVSKLKDDDFHLAADIHYSYEEFGGRGSQKCIKSQEIQVPAHNIRASNLAFR